MPDITCYPEMNADIVKFLRGLDETEHAAICLYAAQRIEDLEAEVRAGAKLCADRQDRINDLDSLLFLCHNTLAHIKSDNDANAREAMVVGLMKILLDETVLRLDRFFGGKEGERGGTKSE